MRNWQGPYVVTKCINDLVYRIQLGPKTKPKVVHWNRLWHYSGHNPPTWLSDKTGSQLQIDVKINNQTNDQTEHQLEQQEQHSNAEASPSQPAIETESDTEYIAPELTHPLRRSGHSWQPPDRYGHLS